MTRSVSKLAFVAALVAAGPASRGLAQAPAGQPFYADVPSLQRTDAVGSPSAPPPGSGTGITTPAPTPNFETGWPRPPIEPPSLYRQQTSPLYGCAPIPGRYFENDPLVDPPSWPQPGWVADISVEAVGAHIFNRLSNGLQVGPNAPGSMHVPITPLQWTVSPVVEFGYRLPEGFGAFMLNYQYLGTTGSGTTPYGPGGPSGMMGRLNFNLSDLDYVSREFTPWEHWGMTWRFGFRQVYLFYDTQLDPFPPASAMSGLSSESGANSYHGWGGHVGVQMDRDFYQQLPGLSFVSKIDFGYTGGFVQQGLSQTTAAGASSFNSITNGQGAPMLGGEIGLSYKPPGSQCEFFVGGFYQYWWNIGTLANYATNGVGGTTSNGELSLTGITFRFSYNY